QCVKKMQDISRTGRTVLFVSHNLDMVPRLCRSGMLLSGGKIIATGDPTAVLAEYVTSLDSSTHDLTSAFHSDGDGRAQFSSAELIDSQGNPTARYISGDDLRIRLTVTAIQRLTNAGIAVNVFTVSGTKVFSAWTRESNMQVTLAKGINTLICTFPA